MKKFVAFVMCLATLSGSVYAQPGSNFDESTLSSWAKADVEKAYALELLQPELARDFQKPITRQEFCDLCTTVIAKWNDCNFTDAENIDSLKAITDKSTFTKFYDTDVWYIDFCAKLGIISGKGNNQFAPNDPITREEAAKMLYNTLNIATPVVEGYKNDNKNGVNGVFLPHVFNDGYKAHSWARNEINATYHLGIMMGDTKNNFNPQGTYTREQAVCTFLRLYNSYKNPEANIMPDPEIYPSTGLGYYSDSTDNIRLDAAYQWGTEGYTFEPAYYDGFGNTYTAKEKGYVYPIGENYMPVMVMAGVGVSREILIDKNGNTVTDAYTIENLNDDEYLIGDGQGNYTRLNKNDGQVKGGSVKSVGCGMYAVYEVTPTGVLQGFKNAEDKTVIPCIYKGVTPEFFNDLAVLQKQDNSFAIVNTKGETLKTFKIDLNKYDVESIYGTNMLLVDKTNWKNTVLRAYSGKYIENYSNIWLTSKGDFIAKQNGKCFLLGKDGSEVADVTAMGYEDISEIGNTPFYCLDGIDETNWSRVEPFALMDSNGTIVKKEFKPFDYQYDSKSGLIAYQSTDNELKVIDYYGNDIGTVKTQNKIERFDFINGLIRVSDGTKAEYFTPEGNAAITNS